MLTWANVNKRQLLHVNTFDIACTTHTTQGATQENLTYERSSWNLVISKKLKNFIYNPYDLYKCIEDLRNIIVS